MTGFIQGTCLLMCPEKERRIREKKGLLHRFEIDENMKGTRLPKADPNKTIKCYGRPAAGLIMTEPSQLRPAPVLLSTVNYLFTNIATRTDVDWIVVYDFIFDRLRSVRQDIVIQRINLSTSIKLFELIVRFLVYAAQRLCERNITEFNRKINDQHLAECITHLLTLYDQLNNPNSFSLDWCMENLTLTNDRQRMEALHILLYMGNTESLTRALNLPLDLRESPEIRLAMKISFSCYLNNYVRVLSLIRQLPAPILVCAAVANIPKLRRMALQVMSSGYNSKVFTFPGMKLQNLLLYKDISKVQADCKLFGLAFTDENISFQKTNFKNEIQLANFELHYTYQTLHHFLPQILLE